MSVLTTDQARERQDAITADDFQEGPITKVEPPGQPDGEYASVSWQDDLGPMGVGFRMGHGVMPKVGDVLRCYGRFGSRVRGMDLNGAPVWFSTEAEMRAEHEQWKRDHDEHRRHEFEEQRPQLDADYDSLPTALQHRIDTLRGADPDWRWQNESYEMFCCTEATKLAEHFDSTEKLNRWRRLPYEEQKAEFPALDEGHSGNTFGAACALAARLIEGRRESIVVMPQAIAPLVGDPRYPEPASPGRSESA